MTDLRALLHSAADDLVPEHDPLGGTLDGVRRLVRRRRAVRRVQAGAGAVVGVVAIGSTALLTIPGLSEPADPSDPAGVCEENSFAVLPEPGVADGFATVQLNEGMSLSLRTQLENLGQQPVTTTGDVLMIVSLQGTGQVVGTATATPQGQVEIAPDSAGDLFTTATLSSCGFLDTAAGDPLPDGTYDLSLTGTATGPDGTEVPWTASTNGITIENGQATETRAEPTAEGEFAPVCGDMIPAVAENPLWSSTSAVGSGPFPAGDPDDPYAAGMTLDLTIGTTSTESLEGELGAEVVTVLTDLDGRVITWWRASDHGRPLDLGPDLTLPAEGTQVFEGFAWFPAVDACAGDAAIPDGRYRIFTWAQVSARTEASTAVEHYPVLSVPLDVEVRDGLLTVG